MRKKFSSSVVFGRRYVCMKQGIVVVEGPHLYTDAAMAFVSAMGKGLCLLLVQNRGGIKFGGRKHGKAV